jgi:hypothetical protein
MQRQGSDMKKKNTITSYVKDLEREMKRNGTFDADTLAELEDHLFESVEANLRRGLNQAEAEEEALRRFGSVHVVLFTFVNERISPMQKILIGIAVLAGLFALYVDTRPNWDDTGVLAGGILLICGLFALIGYQRPWLLALAVGAWIPMYDITVLHNFGSILALIIAFIGAYGGWVFRFGIRKVFNTA